LDFLTSNIFQKTIHSLCPISHKRTISRMVLLMHNFKRWYSSNTYMFCAFSPNWSHITNPSAIGIPDLATAAHRGDGTLSTSNSRSRTIDPKSMLRRNVGKEAIVLRECSQGSPIVSYG
jgi:hypothetical protein